MKKATKSILLLQQQRAQLLSVLVEGASNAYVIQAYRRIVFMESRFDSQLKKTFLLIRKHALLMAAVSPLALVIFSMLMVVSISFGMHELRDGRLHVADLVAYFTYALMLMSSVSQISFLSGQLRLAGTIALKHQYLLEEPQREHTHLRPATVSDGLPEMQLKNINFKYAGATTNALKNVTFSVPAGSITAVVGESGAGKSTVAGVLAGLLAPQAGLLVTLHNGNPVEAHEQLIRMAIVPQEPFLFNGTFFENITFGRESITIDDVKKAAKAARIHYDITQRPGSYYTEIDEGGRNLSRGQRQRIAIARALVGNPNLLLLDEATSSLDIISERAIRALVEELRGTITIVIIAHKGELLDTIDHLVILDHGSVAYEGNPVKLDVYLNRSKKLPVYPE
jgi:ABC-type multidrug transport system fused ATPase/permease subunit